MTQKGSVDVFWTCSETSVQKCLWVRPRLGSLRLSTLPAGTPSLLMLEGSGAGQGPRGQRVPDAPRDCLGAVDFYSGGHICFDVIIQG